MAKRTKKNTAAPKKRTAKKVPTQKAATNLPAALRPYADRIREYEDDTAQQNGHWAHYKSGWKSPSDPLGAVHSDHEDTVKGLARCAKAALRCECSDECKAANPAEPAEPEPLKIRLYGNGQFYFFKAAKKRLGTYPNITFRAEGKTITLTPQVAAKNAFPIRKWNYAPVFQAGKLLKDTGWSKQTQDLIAQPVGDAGFVLEVQ